MNFGLLCDDLEARELIAAIDRHPSHRLVRAVLVSPQADPLLQGLRAVPCTDRWEDLLNDAELDAVIVGGPTAAVWDGAKQLAAAKIALLVFPRLQESGTVLYELSLIRDDQQGVLFPARWFEFDAGIAAWKRAGHAESGTKIAYAAWDVELPLGSGLEVPRDQIESVFFQDAGLWQHVCGTADQVTALRTGGTDTGALIQNVVLVGKRVPELTWTIKAGETSRSTLTLQTSQGVWTLQRDPVAHVWNLSPAEAAPPISSAATPADRLLEAFVEAADQPESSAARWTSVLQGVELVDAVRRSLDRRRTIELHHEPLSERAIFKSQMAAMGCGVLMLTLLLLLGYLGLASLFPPGSRLLYGMRLLIFAPLFLFLLIQLLLPLTRSSSAAR